MIILLKCSSIITITISFILLILFFTKKLKPIPSTLQVYIVIKLILVISVIISILGTIIMFNLQDKDYLEIRSMNDSLNETNSILVKAIYLSQFIDLYFWTHAKNDSPMRIENLALDYGRMLTKDGKWATSDLKYKIDDAFYATKDLNTTVTHLRPTGTTCTTSIYDDLDEMNKQVKEYRLIQTTIKERFEKIKKDVENAHEDVKDRIKSQQEPDLGETVIQGHLDTVNNMFAHFVSNINRSESVRLEHKLQVELSFTRPTIIKVLINITLGALIIFTLLTFLDILLSIGRFIGPNIWSKAVIFLFLFPIFLTIITSSMISAMSFDLLGKFDCPYNGNNSGLPDFMPTFFEKNLLIVGNDPISLCAKPNTTFFSHVLKTAPWIQNDTVAERLQFPKYKEKQLDVFTDPNLLKKIDTSSFEALATATKVLCERLNKQSKTTCLTDLEKTNLLKSETIFEKLIGEFAKFRKTVEEYNESVTNARTKLGLLIDEYDMKMVENFMSSLHAILEMIEDADFNCDPIIKEFSKISHDICEEVYIPLEDSWIFLLLTMILCLTCLFMHILIYRCKLGEKKDQASEIMKSANSTSSTSLLNKTINKSDGQIVTTPA